MSRHQEAEGYYQASLARVKSTPPPADQKFFPGTRVRICPNLGPSMGHFPSGCGATVMHTYAHAFGGDNITSYMLDVDGRGPHGWYYEHQLTEE